MSCRVPKRGWPAPLGMIPWSLRVTEDLNMSWSEASSAMRTILDAIVYMARTLCQSPLIPDDFPSFAMVQCWFYGWRDSGFLDQVLAVTVTTANAWWDEGHMQIAAVAYKSLTAPVKDRADALLRLNKDYPKWTAGAPDEATARQCAFVHAAHLGGRHQDQALWLYAGSGDGLGGGAEHRLCWPTPKFSSSGD